MIDNKNDYMRRWRETNKPRVIAIRRKSNLKTRFGITVEQYETMFLNQNGRCAICGREPDLQRLHVDHDHKTGRVRGLLCMTCNTALGKFSDDPELLRKAIEYLER